MANFENNWRRQQEIKMRPYVDKIYNNIFNSNVGIKRFESIDEFILDKKFAIDVQLTLSNGQILLGQEKFLSNKYARYRTITVEYKQNPITDEDGDWFKLAPQIYFVGYINATNDGFDPWVLMNWTNLVLNSNNNNITWSFNNNKYDGARASFTYTIMDDLPSECIIDCSWNKR